MEIIATGPDVILQAAHKVGVRAEVYEDGHSREGRPKFNVSIWPIGDKYRKMSFRDRHPRQINMVCFHGYKAFIEELLRLDPNMKLMSKFTQASGQRWMTGTNSLWLIDAISDMNMGSQISPLPYHKACACNLV